MGAIHFVILAILVAVVVGGPFFLIYLAVRAGVRHGNRDSRNEADPPTGAAPPPG